MFGIDAIIALAGLILPPAVDFVKKKFLRKDQDTPEQTMSTLATTKPDVLPAYVTATTEYLKAQISYFNRDVSGTPSQWVVDMRAAIRPCGVVGAMVVLGIMAIAAFQGYKVSPDAQTTVDGVRLSCELIVTSWFGDRISISK